MLSWHTLLSVEQTELNLIGEFRNKQEAQHGFQHVLTNRTKDPAFLKRVLA